MTDDTAISYLLSLAEISGVFVGFGALIGALQSKEERDIQKAGIIASVCVIGVVTLLGCLVPLLLSSFGVNDTWFYSSLTFLIIIGTALGLAYSNPLYRASNPIGFSKHPLAFFVFWVLLELPIQAALLCNLFGILPQYASALYLTAVIFNFAESGLFLVMMVFDRDN